MTKRYITKTGNIIWIKLKVAPAQDEEGNIHFFVSQIVPIDIKSDPDITIVHEPSQAQKKVIVWERRKDFLKKNWKPLLTLTGGIIAAIFEFFHVWYNIQDTIKSQTDQIQRLELLLEEKKND